MYLGSSSMPATGKSIDVQLIDIIRLGDDSFAFQCVHGLRLSDPMPSYRGRRAAGFC